MRIGTQLIEAARVHNKKLGKKEAGQKALALLQRVGIKVVRQFAIMTVVWGIVGMLVGVIVAALLTKDDLKALVIAFNKINLLLG